MYLECENVSKKNKNKKSVRHSIYSCAANESGMIIQIFIQDCILSSTQCTWHPLVLNCGLCASWMDSSDSSWFGKVPPFLKSDISVMWIVEIRVPGSSDRFKYCTESSLPTTK